MDNENLAWKWLTDVSRDSEAVFNWGVLRFRQNGRKKSSLDMGNALQSFIIAPEAKKSIKTAHIHLHRELWDWELENGFILGPKSFAYFNYLKVFSLFYQFGEADTSLNWKRGGMKKAKQVLFPPNLATRREIWGQENHGEKKPRR